MADRCRLRFMFDGPPWIEISDSGMRYVLKIIDTGTAFIAMTSYNVFSLRSLDGKAWSDIETSALGYTGAYNAGVAVAVASDGVSTNAVKTSSDHGITWATQPPIGGYDQVKFMAVTNSGELLTIAPAGATRAVRYLSNGIWSQSQYSDLGYGVNGASQLVIASGNNVLFTFGSGTILSSDGGRSVADANWSNSNIPLPIGVERTRSIYRDGYYYLMGTTADNEPVILRSSDGATWENLNFPSNLFGFFFFVDFGFTTDGSLIVALSLFLDIAYGYPVWKYKDGVWTSLDMPVYPTTTISDGRGGFITQYGFIGAMVVRGNKIVLHARGEDGGRFYYREL